MCVCRGVECAVLRALNAWVLGRCVCEFVCVGVCVVECERVMATRHFHTTKSGGNIDRDTEAYVPSRQRYSIPAGHFPW